MNRITTRPPEVRRPSPRWPIRLLLALLPFCPAVALADGYRFVRIDFPDSVYTDARGINARGDIVGSYRDSDDVSHGFLLRQGVFSSIDVPNAVLTLGARGINARGDIVGTFLDSGNAPRGYLLHDGEFTQIDYPDSNATSPLGVNNADDITGRYFDAQDNQSGFILKDGEFHDVRVPGGFNTDVTSVQDNGQVMVGVAQRQSDGAFVGFVRYKPGDFHSIVFPGSAVPCTAARWINQRGDIAGGFAFVDAADECGDAPHHGFLLRKGQYTRIDVPGSTHTRALAVNDDGVIVGEYTDGGGNMHGFRAIPKN